MLGDGKSGRRASATLQVPDATRAHVRLAFTATGREQRKVSQRKSCVEIGNRR
jgi:hypothetical protein